MSSEPDYDEREIQEEVQGVQQVQQINISQFENTVRQLIDLSIQSGIDKEAVENTLNRLARGVEFYYEDAFRYAGIQQEESTEES